MPLTPNILFAKWPMEDSLWNALCNGEYPFDTSKFSDPACSIYFGNIAIIHYIDRLDTIFTGIY